MAGNDRPLPADLLSTRPPVTAHEATTLKLISDSIAGSATYHLEGGITKPSLPSDEPCLLYMAKTEGERAARTLPLFTASQKDLEELHKVCIPPQSKDGEVDKALSLAQELPAGGFGLNVAIAPTATISSFGQKGVEAIPYKLNSYTEGASYKANQDRSKDNTLLGTLIIGLPTSYEGGTLVLRQGAQSITLDWSTNSRNGDDSLLWTFFYSDVQYEILPITSGHCITLIYDVFATNYVKYRTPIALQSADVKNTALYINFRRALRDAEFFPNGGRFAFGLAHEYTHDELHRWRPFDGILKGTDRILWQVLTELGMEVDYQAAYTVDLYEDRREQILEEAEDEEETRYQLDAFSSAFYDRWDITVLMLSGSFGGIDQDGMFEDTPWNRLTEDADAKVGWDLVWVTRPKKYVVASTYACEEGCETGTIDVSGALLVEVPPAGGGCRAMSAA